MAGYDSPNFKKNVQPSKGQLREFNVGLPEEDTNSPNNFIPLQQPPYQQTPEEIEALARIARQEKLAAANKIGDQGKKRIEMLADIGRLTKDVKIGEFTFSLRTLKARETKDASLATFSTAITNLEASYEARKQQLARSVFKIDGQDIGLIIGSTNLEDRMRFLEDNLEDIVVEKLWSEFLALKEEAKTQYGINTVKEAEEVVEDLKK
jgi:hypothetical protein